MPYFSSTIFVVVLALAALAALTGYFLFAQALFPAFVQRAEAAWTDRPLTAFALGVPVASVLAFASTTLLTAGHPLARVVGFVVTGVALGFVFAGTAGLAGRLAQRLGSSRDNGREWRSLVRAGIVLELTMLLPALGWFVVMPVAVIGGAGAATFALFRRKRSAQASPALVPTVTEKLP